MKKLLTILLVGLIGAHSAHAANASGTIKRLYPKANGSIAFTLSSTCLSGDYFVIASTDVMLTKWYALLLAAAEAGASITVNFGGTCSAGDKTVDYMYRNYP